MIAGSISRRYARALIELADEAGQVELVLKELLDFEEKMHTSDALSMVLTNPSFRSDQRVAVLEELFSSLQYHELTRKFLILTTRKQRMTAFAGIVREYRNFYDQLRGLVRVEIISAVALPEALEEKLVAAVEQRMQRKAVVTRKIDPSIIGGIITRVDDLMIDGSVATRLRRLKHSLLHEDLN